MLRHVQAATESQDGTKKETRKQGRNVIQVLRTTDTNDPITFAHLKGRMPGEAKEKQTGVQQASWPGPTGPDLGRGKELIDMAKYSSESVARRLWLPHRQHHPSH